MAGFDNDVVYGTNVDFSGNSQVAATVTTNGQLLIGSTAAPNIQVGQLTSPLGTLSIGYSSPNITLDLVGGSTGIDSIAMQAGTSPVVPDAAGLVTFNGNTVSAGTSPVRTRGIAANTMALEVQRSVALAATDATRVGLSNFDSANFTVDANGFVELIGSVPLAFVCDSGTATPAANSLTCTVSTGGQTIGSGSTLTVRVRGGGLDWLEVTGTSAVMAIDSAYIANNVGLVTLTLPAVTEVGDIVRVAGKGAGGWRIAQSAGQTIHFGNQDTTTGAGGRLDSTNRYDCIELVAITNNTDFVVLNSVGNITIT